MNAIRHWGGLVAAAVLAATLTGCTSTAIFRDGHAMLPVIVATDAAPEERTAANELARVLGQMSGLAWPIGSPAEFPGPGFYVGVNAGHTGQGARWKVAADLLSPQPGECGPDTFLIQSQGRSVIVAGATPEATGFAVAWLLQSQAGVRWYAPGAIGEVIPRRTSWSLPSLHVQRSPAYVSREIYGPQSTRDSDWARHNGLRARFEFNHALAGIFLPEAFELHPDWAPLLKGARYQPRSAAEANWQPNLALPAVATHAAQAAAARFARAPAQAGFSLGINDTVRFDESAATRALVEPLRYFRGMPDYSPLVFTFMNRAAEGMAGRNPGHYLGCLAYFWCEQPPPFLVNPSVVPYVTTDRSQYFDAAYRAADLALMSRWGASGVKAYGLWEYSYGHGFIVPRLPHRAFAEAIREGWRRGARGYMADAESAWGFDAYKMWLTARLLWDPEQPLTELADDFFSGYYGAAAQPMRRFYDRCEDLWMAQTGPAYWLKYYQQEDQAGLFPAAACQELRSDLAAAAQAAAGDPAVLDRIAQTSRAFAVTEAYVSYDDIRRALASLSDTGAQIPEGGEKLLADLIKDYLRDKARLTVTYAEMQAGEVPPGNELAYFVRNDPVPRLLWLAGQRDPLAARRILAELGPDAAGETTWSLLAERLADGGLKAGLNLVRNPQFEQVAPSGQEPAFLFPHAGRLPAEWIVEAMPNEAGRVGLVNATVGSPVLRIEGAWDTQVFQWQKAGRGRLYVATARLRGNCVPGSDAGLFLTFLTRDGRVAGTSPRQSLPKGLNPQWRSAVVAGLVPEDATWVGVGIAASRQGPGDWLEANMVELRGVDGEPGP